MKQQKLMSVKQFADLRKTTINTVYSWIRREECKKQGFEVVKVGTMTLIQATAR